MDKAMTMAVNNNHVSICSGLAVILNAKLLACSQSRMHVRRIIVSYLSVDCSLRYSSVYGTAVTLRNRLLFVVEYRTLAFRYKRYGQLTLAIVGLLVK